MMCHVKIIYQSIFFLKWHKNIRAHHYFKVSYIKTQIGLV